MKLAHILHEILTSFSAVRVLVYKFNEMLCTYFARVELGTIILLSVYKRFKNTFILKTNGSSNSSGRVAEIIWSIVHPCLPSSSLVIPDPSNFFSSIKINTHPLLSLFRLCLIFLIFLNQLLAFSNPEEVLSPINRTRFCFPLFVASP